MFCLTFGVHFRLHLGFFSALIYRIAAHREKVTAGIVTESGNRRWLYGSKVIRGSNFISSQSYKWILRQKPRAFSWFVANKRCCRNKRNEKHDYLLTTSNSRHIFAASNKKQNRLLTIKNFKYYGNNSNSNIRIFSNPLRLYD